MSVNPLSQGSFQECVCVCVCVCARARARGPPIYAFSKLTCLLVCWNQWWLDPYKPSHNPDHSPLDWWHLDLSAYPVQRKIISQTSLKKSGKVLLLNYRALLSAQLLQSN